MTLSTFDRLQDLHPALDAIFQDTHPSQTKLDTLRKSVQKACNTTASFAIALLKASDSGQLIQFYERMFPATCASEYHFDIQRLLCSYYDTTLPELLARNEVHNFFRPRRRQRCSVVMELVMQSFKKVLDQSQDIPIAKQILERYNSIRKAEGTKLSTCDALVIASFIECEMKEPHKTTHFHKRTYDLPCTLDLRADYNIITASLKGAQRIQPAIRGSYKSVSHKMHIPLDATQGAYLTAESVNNIGLKPRSKEHVYSLESREAIYIKCEKEFDIASQLIDAPGVVSLLSVHRRLKPTCYSSPVPQISITWPLAHGDLHELYRKSLFPQTLPEQLQIARDLVTGVISMHDRRICHGDIKAENALYHKNEDAYSATWCDFSHSFRLDHNRKRFRDGFYGSTTHTAPELFLNYDFTGDYKKLDVWALGLVLYTLCISTSLYTALHPILKSPVHSISAQNQMNTVVTTHIETPLADLLKKAQKSPQDEFHIVIHQLLRLNPEARMDLRDSLNQLQSLLAQI